MRPKKKPSHGVTLKERPFSHRARKDGSVEVLWKGRPAVTLTGKLAENLIAALPEEDEHGQQLLMARATGNFKRGNERRR